MAVKPDAEESKRLHAPDVNYFPPSRGPFLCGNCEYFRPRDSYCEQPVVRAPVDYSGCCNLFETK